MPATFADTMGQGRNRIATLGVAALGIWLAGPSFAVETMEFRPPPRPIDPWEEASATVLDPAPIEIPDEDPAPDIANGEDLEPLQFAWMNARTPAPRPDGLLKGHEFRFALEMARRGDWDGAKALAAEDSAVAADIIEWQRLRAGKGNFDDYRDFLARRGDWPGLKLLRKRGEAAIIGGSYAPHVVAYFEPEPPQTGLGALHLAEAYGKLGRFRESRATLIQAWTTMEMKQGEEAAYLAEYGEVLAPYHIARLDDTLWRGDREGAGRMLRFADEEHAALAKARLALQRKSGNADALWKAVPDKLANDAGLAHDRMNWLVANKRRGDAANLMLARSTSAASLGRPETWTKWRRIFARQAMRDGRAKRAYDLASTHFTKSAKDTADLEWLAGFIALTDRNRPGEALAHFGRFRDEIDTPISLGRAGYWQGRAYEAMGEAAKAKTAYTDAAQYQTSFYGLLAAEKISAPMRVELTGSETRSWADAAFTQSSVLAAAQLFHKVGQQYEVTRFLRHLSETTAQDELIALGDFAVSLNDPYIAVRVGKQIAREGAVAHRAYYPLTDLGPESLPVEEALALAIARRESEFYSRAVSHVGARGLMQLMPGTAQDMARKTGLAYERARLTGDPVYNVVLGSAYLAQLQEDFGNNIVLISVGYNAGPGRANSWMGQRGDPRRGGVDVVDWIEHIPFDETRNYVMRVAESLPVYRARLTGKTAPIELLKELKAR